MGDRAMAEIKTDEGSLFFYTHWHGETLLTIAKNALEEAEPRRGDSPYALRRVVDSLIKQTDSRDAETGSGLMLRPNAEDEYNSGKPSVIIDLNAWEVQVKRG